MSSSLWLHQLLHAGPPCPSPNPRVYSNSCPLSRWYNPTISSSVIPFSSCLQSFPASWYFPMSQFFASGGQSIRVSALTSVLPMNIQDWFPSGWTGWISLKSKGLSQESPPTPQFKSINSLVLFNILSRLVITFLPRSKHLLTSWLQSPSAVTLEPPKIKSDTVSTVSPSI